MANFRNIILEKSQLWYIIIAVLPRKGRATQPLLSVGCKHHLGRGLINKLESQIVDHSMSSHNNRPILPKSLYYIYVYPPLGQTTVSLSAAFSYTVYNTTAGLKGG